MRNKAVAIASVLIALGAFMWLWTNERMWLIFASLTATTMFFSLSYCFYLEKKKDRPIHTHLWVFSILS